MLRVAVTPDRIGRPLPDYGSPGQSRVHEKVACRAGQVKLAGLLFWRSGLHGFAAADDVAGIHAAAVLINYNGKPAYHTFIAVALFGAAGCLSGRAFFAAVFLAGAFFTVLLPFSRLPLLVSSIILIIR